MTQPSYEGVPVLDLLLALNSKVGAERLRATAILLRAGPEAVPVLVDALSAGAESVMNSLWGEVLLQTVYATSLAENQGLLQDAYFERRAVVRRTLFETLGAEALPFWTMCLAAPDWETREEAALVIGGLRAAAEPALQALRDARDAEENEDAQRTMETAIAAVQRAIQAD